MLASRTIVRESFKLRAFISAEEAQTRELAT